MDVTEFEKHEEHTDTVLNHFHKVMQFFAEFFHFKLATTMLSVFDVSELITQ